MRLVAAHTGLQRVAWIAPILLFVPLAWAGDNLLANPGFEKLSVDQPVRWNLFVQPQEGAFGRIDDTAHSGKYAVQLHIPTPYPRDPANNWSQNILGEFGGQRLRLSGYLKTADATEAALWLQCWRKRPLGGYYTALLPARTRPFTEIVIGNLYRWNLPCLKRLISLSCVVCSKGSAAPGLMIFSSLSLRKMRQAKT